jgi:DNA-directed RNA polymerase subunit RPC12/RpoP
LGISFGSRRIASTSEGFFEAHAAGGRKTSGYREPRRRDWLKTLVFIAAYIAVLGLSAIYLLLSYWYVWIVLAAVGLVILVSWHAKATAYRCPSCGYEFEIFILTDFLSPHGVDGEGGWKYLNCPNCSKRSRMKMIAKTEDSSKSISIIPTKE